MPGRKTPRHHTGHTEPIRTPALRHSIDGNHPELREGQEDSALTAVLVGFSTFGVRPLQRTELADRAHACRCARRADGPRLFGPAGVIHPPAGRGDLL